MKQTRRIEGCFDPPPLLAIQEQICHYSDPKLPFVFNERFVVQ